MRGFAPPCPPDYLLFPNVHWLARTADHQGLRDGEANLVLAHPDRGLVVLETKAGRDSARPARRAVVIRVETAFIPDGK